MTTDAQKQANKTQDAARKGRRFQLWLEIADDKRVRRIMRKEKLPSKIAAVRFLLEAYEGKGSASAPADVVPGQGEKLP